MITPPDERAALAAQVRRMETEQAALVALARAGLPFDEAVLSALEVAADTLAISRTSLWMLSDDRQTLTCVALFQRPSRAHSAGEVLNARDYPTYFAAIDEGWAIDARDAWRDPRTQEFREAYLVPLGIHSLLDAAVRDGPRVVGVLCCEHVGADRTWEPDEVTFVGALAEQLALARAEAMRSRLESELSQAQRLEVLGTLAASIAHEINNPLAYILGNLDFIARALTSPDEGSIAELTEAVREATIGIERVGAIVQGLRRFARRGKTEGRPVAVADAVESAARMAASQLRMRARLVVALGPTPLVCADETGLVQVVLNLLLNAAQAIEEGRPHENEIRVTAVEADGWVEIAVRDTGSGIPPAVLDRIFDPFFTSKPAAAGTGLGLTISEAIVRSLGGELRIESVLGQGTTARVRLPVASADLAVAPPPVSAPSRGLRILVIDDEETLVRSVCRYFEAAHTIEGVTSADAGLERLQSGAPFDVVLCDLMMPGMSGMALYDAVERSHPALVQRMVFMTGGAFTTRAAEFLKRVPNRRLAKPFRMAELRSLFEASAADA